MSTLVLGTVYVALSAWVQAGSYHAVVAAQAHPTHRTAVALRSIEPALDGDPYADFVKIGSVSSTYVHVVDRVLASHSIFAIVEGSLGATIRVSRGDWERATRVLEADSRARGYSKSIWLDGHPWPSLEPNQPPR